MILLTYTTVLSTRSRFTSWARTWVTQSTGWFASPPGKVASRWLRRGISALVFGGLLVQLSRVGWHEVLEALPQNPLFYALIIVSYLALPITETIIYRSLWNISPRTSIWTFIRKRIYNIYVIEYSGELYLYNWAKPLVSRSTGDLLRDIRDVNILSNLASVLLTVLLIGGFAATGMLDLGALLPGEVEHYGVVGLFLLVLLVAVGYRFRHHVFSMAPGMALRVLGLHFCQVMVINLLRLGQWAVAVPTVPLTAWALLLSTMLLIERLPLIPNKDLVLVSASVELAAVMDVAEAEVAGMLLVASVFGKLLHLVVASLAQIIGPPRNADNGAPVLPSSEREQII